MRNDRPDRATSTSPASSSAMAYSFVARRSRSATRPPGRRTRPTSKIARSRSAAPCTLWIASDETTASSLRRGRQGAHVGVEHLDALGDALRLGVGKRRGTAGVGLVGLRPDVDADGAARRQPLRRADQQQPASAADVEHVLVAPQAEAVEEAVALDELPAPARVQHRGDRQEEHRARQPQRAGERGHPEDGERDRDGDERRARDREAADDAGRVEPVVGLHTVMSARAVSGPSPRCRRECVRP